MTQGDSALLLWIPAFAVMTGVCGMAEVFGVAEVGRMRGLGERFWWGIWRGGRSAGSGIPCSLASLVRAPFVARKGLFADSPPYLGEGLMLAAPPLLRGWEVYLRLA